MKKILGLDLGITSIGAAYVHEDEHQQSKIIKTIVRVNPLSTDEQTNFTKGKSITINEDRTQKRGMRRNLHRYKLRRSALIELLTRIGFIDKTTILTEDGKISTHTTYKLRAKAPVEKLEKEELARVLLMINKKRGYKSSRKADNQEDGQLIDGMAIAKKLYDSQKTPGQLCLEILSDGKKNLPDFYRSDLQSEFDKIWNFQQQFYPESLTAIHKEKIYSLPKTKTGQYFEKQIGTPRAEIKGTQSEKKIQTYQWRSQALTTQVSLAEAAFILTEIQGEIHNSSGYLGAISDRSKALYFSKETVGQYQYRLLLKDPHTSLKNQVFYRQDYIDEFNAIWKQQSLHYPALTPAIKKELESTILFYQRPLKSQKGLISTCQLESKERNIIIDGETKVKTTGPKVAPKSSPIFQQAKIWQEINHLNLKNEETHETLTLEDELRTLLFTELNWREGYTKSQLLTFLKKHAGIQGKHWKTNLENIEGNRTNAALIKVYDEILQIEGYTPIDYKKPMSEILEQITSCFAIIGIDTAILTMDYSLQANDFSKQAAYHLWHLLYSYEGDSSPTGTESLKTALQSRFGFSTTHTRLLAGVTFDDKYGNLSVRALRKLLPFLRDGNVYSDACALAGYHHSKPSPKKNNTVVTTLPLIKKNELRNPVVEKILNQMINMVNTILEHPDMGRPDEIRIELARELKKTAKQRGEMTTAIARATEAHKKYKETIKKDFGLSYVSRKDLIKYKLYLELKATGYKTLYSDTYIKPEELFTPKFDVEHIIPQSVLFDDSFSNKTLELRRINQEKGNETAMDYCSRKGWLDAYKTRIEECYAKGKGSLSYGKRQKLLMRASDIPEGFINRDLTNSAYIARKAKEILDQIGCNVHVSTGKITDRLRSDWELTNVLQELNWEKYKALGLTYYEYNKEGKALPRIKDWTKRNDHRHHAMDAIAIAFTNPALVQYLNTLHAKSDKNHVIHAIEQKYTYRDQDGKRKFIKPAKDLRSQAKEHLSNIFISHKAKNKVVTQNKNTTKLKGKGTYKTKTELTPRGQLHKETIYGHSYYYEIKEEKINGAFTEEKIKTIINSSYRNALLKRLQAYDSAPKKAFTGKNSLAKNPVLTADNESVPATVQTKQLTSRYTIRKPITPELKIEKVVDEQIKKLLYARLKAYNNKPKEAFSNLDDAPIWFNKKKGIAIKRVTITGVSNALPLHEAKNHRGVPILDHRGNPIPVDYVSPGNNHHIAIFQNPEGELDDEAVSFFEAVVRKNKGIPVISPKNEKGWPLLFTLKQNEMFVFPSENFNPQEVDLTDPVYASLIHQNLYRVQKISKLQYGTSISREYMFRHHLETEVNDIKVLKGVTWKPIKSLKPLQGIVKVRLNHIGDIVQIGES